MSDLASLFTSEVSEALRCVTVGDLNSEKEGLAAELAWYKPRLVVTAVDVADRDNLEREMVVAQAEGYLDELETIDLENPSVSLE